MSSGPESCHDDNDGDDENYHDHDHDNGHDNKILIYYTSSQKNAVIFEFLKLGFVNKIFKTGPHKKKTIHVSVSWFCWKELFLQDAVSVEVMKKLTWKAEL